SVWIPDCLSPVFPGRIRRQLEYARNHGRPVRHLHRNRGLQCQPGKFETGDRPAPSPRTNERDDAFPRLGHNTSRSHYWWNSGRVSGIADRDWNSYTRRIALVSLDPTLSSAFAQDYT